LYERMFDRIEMAADKMKSAKAMLIKTSPKSMLDLTRIAFDF
jgi:hypothetical protein